MNYNILAYSIYLAIMVFIIVYVGRLFHRNGRVFILGLFKNEADKADNMNNILLLAYYLFNIGYTFLKLRYWDRVQGIGVLISSLSNNIGLLVLILSVTHYFNMFIIHYLSKKESFLHQ